MAIEKRGRRYRVRKRGEVGGGETAEVSTNDGVAKVWTARSAWHCSQSTPRRVPPPGRLRGVTVTTEAELQAHVSLLAERFEVPGVAVGVVLDRGEHVACHGVTSVEDPLPVDRGTLFQIGSTVKTYTATAILRLVEEGRIDVHAPVRTYLPDLRLKDEQVAREVTVLHLLNHTAGWDGDLFEDTGEGDDALDRYVRRMATIEQVTPLGSTVSYNNASLGLAGLVIEKVTGKPYEQVIRELLLEPLGMTRSCFFAKEIMTYRFSNGHRRSQDGTISVTRPWDTGRYGAPMGGLSSNVGDQLAWARFHMGDGRAPGGTRILSEELLRRMQDPTVSCPGNALGDAVGISWLLRDVEGTRVVAHGGDTTGQYSIFEMVPDQSFAITSLTNCGPNGWEFNEWITRWAFEAYLGIKVNDPEPVRLSDEALAVYAGRYETIAAINDVKVADGGLLVDHTIRPEVLTQLGEEAADDPPEPIGLLPGEGDRYVVTGGPARGMRGYFSRGRDGSIDGMHIDGRFATRVR
jgi:CubicO group peptidase (beta-lactamase class C family)